MAYRARDNLYSHILTEEQVAELIRLWKAGYTLKQLSEQFDVHQNTVSNIINRYVSDLRRKRAT